MKTENYISNTVRYRVYKLSEIKIGDFVQLLYASKVWKWKNASMSCHFTVSKLDPTISWKIMWKWECSQKGENGLFHVDNIQRNYTTHPIIIEAWNHKNKKQIPFNKLEYEAKHGIRTKTI